MDGRCRGLGRRGLADVLVPQLGPRRDERLHQLHALRVIDLDGVEFIGVSYKGGAPGLVRVLDSRTIVFPNYDGNGMYLSMGNLAETQAVGLLFIDFEAQRRMRVDGSAQLSTDASLIERYPEAQFVVRSPDPSEAVRVLVGLGLATESTGDVVTGSVDGRPLPPAELLALLQSGTRLIH